MLGIIIGVLLCFFVVAVVVAVIIYFTMTQRLKKKIPIPDKESVSMVDEDAVVGVEHQKATSQTNL